jgi:hypothetical protein
MSELSSSTDESSIFFRFLLVWLPPSAVTDFGRVGDAFFGRVRALFVFFGFDDARTSSVQLTSSSDWWLPANGQRDNDESEKVDRSVLSSSSSDPLPPLLLESSETLEELDVLDSSDDTLFVRRRGMIMTSRGDFNARESQESCG